MSGVAAYLKGVLPSLPALRVVDVGANPISQPLYQPLMDAGMAEVWGFEPDPKAFAEIEPTDRVKVLPQAVGRPETVQFHAYKSSEMSSVYPLSERALGYLGHFNRHLGTETVVEMETHALDDLAEVPQIDFLKVDAQGSEVAVLDGGFEKLQSAVAVVVEARFYRLYEGEPSLGDLDMALRGQGFVLHRFLHQKARMIGHSQRARVNPRRTASQLIDGDAVYIRNLEDRAIWSVGQLGHLAWLAATVFESHDLALMLLDELEARGAASPGAAEGYVAQMPERMQA